MRAPKWFSIMTMLGGLGLWSPLAALPARAEPPMWMVSSPYAHIYLFGTIHVLPVGFTWDSTRLDATIKNTREIWLEISAQAIAQDLPQAFRHLGFDPKENLKAKLSAPEIQKLVALPMGKLAATDPDLVDHMRPWFAAMAYQGRHVEHGRYVPGVDVAIMAKAVASGTALYGLESPEQQLTTLASVPEEKALQTLHAVLSGKATDPHLIDRLATAWAAGDVPAVEPIVTEMKENDPEQYEQVLVGRNQHWAGRLAPRLNGGGSALIAVGLAHLIGPDSLPNLLRKRGFTVRRLDAGKDIDDAKPSVIAGK